MDMLSVENLGNCHQSEVDLALVSYLIGDIDVVVEKK